MHVNVLLEYDKNVMECLYIAASDVSQIENLYDLEVYGSAENPTSTTITSYVFEVSSIADILLIFSWLYFWFIASDIYICVYFLGYQHMTQQHLF